MIKNIEELIIGRVLFPSTNLLLNRRGILRDFSWLSRTERLSEEEYRAIQNGKLKNLLDFAYKRVPFYRERFRQAGISPEEIRGISDINRLPLLNRQDVIDHHHDMVDEKYISSALSADGNGRATGAPIPFALFRKNRLVRNTSSGSTGAPTIFYEDGSRTALNWALELRLRAWFGIGPGAREARLVRVATQYMPGARDLQMRRALWNQLILPGVNLGQEDFAHSYDQLKNFRPRVLWGFTSAIAGLAAYVRDENLDPGHVRPELIITWAAPLYEHEERLLREVFGCAITNIYGAREVGHIAARCPEGSFHINEENLLVEEVETQESFGSEGGEIVVTTLDRSVMPFLRYRMGDIGRIVRRECGCGRSLMVIDELVGRTGEVFTTRDGRLISPNFWCRTFMNPELSGRIDRFQVIYKSDSEMVIRIVRGESYDQRTDNFLKSFLDENFESEMTIKFEYPSEIRPQLSGKYQMVINESDRSA